MVLMNVTINKLVCATALAERRAASHAKRSCGGVVKMSYLGLLMNRQYSQLKKKNPTVFGFLGMRKVHLGKDNVPLSSAELLLLFFFNLYFPK